MSLFVSEEELLQSIEWDGSGHHPITQQIFQLNEPIYDIDARLKTINVPDFLGVQNDHQAERVFFRINRVVNNIDLASTVCIIQYKIKTGEKFIYVVPYYDILTEAADMKMIFPWNIKKSATKVAGEIEFSIKFYKTTSSTINNSTILLYEFNTIPTKTKILEGQESIGDIVIDSSDEAKIDIDDFWLELQNIQQVKEEFQLFWQDA